ncbi:hypothetical protein [[Mycobacterium] nativiensis]|uniref:Uncharacterized protein n=1 Tax=[Mycobacterium] nativiensis TaxID=2855503 RepID=A0ABU5XVL6_9MYCO|nr:hypothetical protein [Mycolicibacter sp. MYC340]MEB3031782.1 hypothetical protein [Mycolicibacter sp. MYC340]
MIETFTAAADLMNAIPTLWQSAKYPAAAAMTAVGVGSGIHGLTKGFGTAAARMIGGIALAALVIGSDGLTASTKTTIDRHGGITTGQYGR